VSLLGRWCVGRSCFHLPLFAFLNLGRGGLELDCILFFIFGFLSFLGLRRRVLEGEVGSFSNQDVGIRVLLVCFLIGLFPFPFFACLACLFLGLLFFFLASSFLLACFFLCQIVLINNKLINCLPSWERNTPKG
jgi:hypothetical protein